MNAYYSNANHEKKLSHNAIPHINVGHGFIEFICSLVAFFTCRAVVNIFKISLSLVCFIAFFGVVGGMDSCSIGMGTGFVLCAAITLIEAAILRSMIAKNSDKTSDTQ